MERSPEKKAFQQELSDLIEIQRMVRRCLAQCFDQENVASSIWLELWQKSQTAGEHITPTWKHVRNRCIDELRKVIRRKECPLERARSLCVRVRASEEVEANQRDNVELLDQIMKCPSLGAEERLLLYRRFYAGATLKEVSRELGKSKTTVKRLFKDIINRLRLWIIETDLGRERDVE